MSLFLRFIIMWPPEGPIPNLGPTGTFPDFFGVSGRLRRNCKRVRPENVEWKVNNGPTSMHVGLVVACYPVEQLFLVNREENRYQRPQLLRGMTKEFKAIWSCTLAIIRYLERKQPFTGVSEHIIGRPQVSDNQLLGGIPLEEFKTYHLGNSNVPLVEYRSKRTKTARKCHHFRPLNSMHVFIAFGIRVVDIVGFIVHLYH